MDETSKKSIILTVAEDAVLSNLSELLNDLIKDIGRLMRIECYQELS